MFNPFKFEYTIVHTGKPGVVTLTPTSKTWMKAFAPSLVLGVFGVAAYAWAAYEERMLTRDIEEFNNTASLPRY